MGSEGGDTGDVAGESGRGTVEGGGPEGVGVAEIFL